ncbi:MAG: hypothetical protein ACRDT0_05655 [Pseudonocardiaceae bacterium]
MRRELPNGLLHASRERTPSRLAPGECMSRRELAEAVNAWPWETTRKRYELDAHTLARYERGAVRWPGAAYRSGLRHVLGAARDAELGFWPARQHSAPAQPGAGACQLGAAAVAPLPLADCASAEPLDRLASAAWRPSRVDLAIVEHLELVTQTHRVLYHSLCSVELVAAVTGHLQVITLLMDGAQRLPLRRRLAAVAGETAGHAAWLFHDLGDQPTAARHYTMAETALREAGDPALDAYVRGFRSLVLGSEGQVGEALIFARNAVETAARSIAAAERALREALDALAADCSRRRAEVLIDLARVRAQQQDADEAAGLARQSLTIAVDTGSVAGIRRVRRFRPELARWDGARSVTALDEQLDGAR